MKLAANIPACLMQSLPAHGQEPDWHAALREQYRQAFLAHGLPNRSDERWKYTDLSIIEKHNFRAVQSVHDVSDVIDHYRLKQDHLLLVMVNGRYIAEFTDQKKIPDGLIITTVSKALSQHEDLIKQHFPKPINAANYPFASLNAAVFSDGLFIYLPKDCVLSQPIHLLSLSRSQQEFIAHPYHLVIASERSQLTLLEEYCALSDTTYMMNVVTQIVVGKEAQLDHYKIQNENRHAIHMAHTFINQAQSSRASFTDFSFGSLFARDDIVVKLQEPDALCRTGGFYRLHNDNQYIDHHIDIEHIGKRTSSEMLYKGILDKKSRAVFNGRLHVNENAQKILAYQANHNLLLSNNSEVYSKPELVISADDVKCKHGATTGQLDQDALFYLRSRGISQNDAMYILTRGFAEEIMQRIAHQGIKMRVRETYEE